MDEYQSLSHSRWECKYHVVFIPKCRRRTLYEELRRHEVFRRLAANSPKSTFPRTSTPYVPICFAREWPESSAVDGIPATGSRTIHVWNEKGLAAGRDG